MGQRVYRKLYDVNNSTKLIGLLDELTQQSVPLDLSNAAYVEYKKLEEQGKAVTLNLLEPIPVLVTPSDEKSTPVFSPSRPASLPPKAVLRKELEDKGVTVVDDPDKEDPTAILPK